ncbi:MAG: DUF4932 domain-containing protein [Elusimicrobiota bacterium]|nr:MAG: DUF4932 domain-containing protein [Elusimicrobiota bacterium]
MILAPLLPREFAVNVSRGGVETRVRCGSSGYGGKLTFELDAFDACVAHERVHTVVGPLVAASRAAFEALPGRPPATCRDRSSWEGCYEEHLVRAITLRARGAARSRAVLASWSRSGYPYLRRLCAELEGFEGAGGTTLAEFHPRLLAAFLLESQA